MNRLPPEGPVVALICQALPYTYPWVKAATNFKRLGMATAIMVIVTRRFSASPMMAPFLSPPRAQN